MIPPLLVLLKKKKMTEKHLSQWKTFANSMARETQVRFTLAAMDLFSTSRKVTTSGKVACMPISLVTISVWRVPITPRMTSGSDRFMTQRRLSLSFRNKTSCNHSTWGSVKSTEWLERLSSQKSQSETPADCADWPSQASKALLILYLSQLSP